MANKAESDSSRGILITGDYWHIEGLDIRHAPDNGIKIEGSGVVVVRCAFHHNRDSGLQIGLAKNDANDGTKVAGNQVIGCDSYRNYDSYTKGANADGFACKLFPGKGNSFYGCRSWENSDDGFDFYHTEHRITVDRCWTWHNGDYTLFQATDDWGGNGQGFKLGDGSDCIDKGVDIGIPFAGAAPDLGAYESGMANAIKTAAGNTPRLFHAICKRSGSPGRYFIDVHARQDCIIYMRVIDLRGAKTADLGLFRFRKGHTGREITVKKLPAGIHLLLFEGGGFREGIKLCIP